MSKKPSFNHEQKLLSNNYDLVFGMDEVGRGSFAGPLVAAAVSFKQELTDSWFKEINDSKQINKLKREELSKLIKNNTIYYHQRIEVKDINKRGIGKSNVLIFKKLIRKIKKNHKNKNIHFLIDGRKTFETKNTDFIIKGDQKSISIAAASIIAKVYRDSLMTKYHKTYPSYNFLKNMGYGTKFHRDAILRYGLCELHRTSFRLNKFL